MFEMDEKWVCPGGNHTSRRDCCTLGFMLVVYRDLFNPHQNLVLRVRNFAGKETVYQSLNPSSPSQVS